MPFSFIDLGKTQTFLKIAVYTPNNAKKHQFGGAVSQTPYITKCLLFPTYSLLVGHIFSHENTLCFEFIIRIIL